jgi:hypothetical protein
MEFSGTFNPISSWTARSSDDENRVMMRKIEETEESL